MLFLIPIFVTFLILLLTSLYYYFTRDLHYWKKRGVNGPTPLPFIGNLLDTFLRSTNLVEEERLLKYGRIYGTLEGIRPVITIGDPELLKMVTIKDFFNFRNRLPILPNDPVLSLIIDDQRDRQWWRLRKIVSPAFTSGKLKRMCPLIEQCVEQATNYFAAVCDKQDIELKKVSSAFTMDSITKCVLGFDTNCFNDPDCEFLTNASSLVKFHRIRILLTSVLPTSVQKKLVLDVIPNRLKSFFVKNLKRVVESTKVMKEKRVDFVQLLLDAEMSNEDLKEMMADSSYKKESENGYNSLMNTKLTENEIVAQLFLFMAAGFETTATMLHFFMYSMALESECQQKLFNEIQRYNQRNKGELNYDELMTMPYLDAVLNETLRLYTPSINLNRYCEEDYVLGDTGITIPKGTVVNLPFYAIHHDPILYPSPHQFKPERFMPENKDQIHPYSFVPFGVGPRNCVGLRFALLSAKIFVVKLINEFEIRKSPRTPAKPTYTSTSFSLACKPLFAKFVRRANGYKTN